ncbi:MAG: MEDS domain-containing protein [Spirochaetota bacterium]
MCHPDGSVDLGFRGERYAAGTHICLVYRDDAERRRIVRHFVESGLFEDEQVFYLADTAERPDVDAWLANLDIDPTAIRRDSSLQLEQALATYCPDGTFYPLGMTETLKRTYEAARSRGFTHARVSGEMSWALKKLPGSDRLIEYESMVNDVVRTHPITAMCQYNANAFDGITVFRALQVHPFMVLGGQIVRNPYFES